MVSPNQFYGMLRDENLRLMYAEQEKAFIDERIFKNKWFSIFYIVYLSLYIIIFSYFYSTNDYELRLITITILCFSISFILLILLGPFVEAAVDYRRFLAFRNDHQKFLARYNRS